MEENGRKAEQGHIYKERTKGDDRRITSPNMGYHSFPAIFD